MVIKRRKRAEGAAANETAQTHWCFYCVCWSVLVVHMERLLFLLHVAMAGVFVCVCRVNALMFWCG